jgi:hypothetical protein
MKFSVGYNEPCTMININKPKMLLGSPLEYLTWRLNWKKEN